MEKVLSEVHAVVLAMGKEYQIRIPDDVWSAIEENKDKSYQPIIDENKALNEQGLLIDTVTFIAMLHRDYWCNSEEELSNLLQELQENEDKYNSQLINAGNTRDLLKMLRKK